MAAVVDVLILPSYHLDGTDVSVRPYQNVYDDAVRSGITAAGDIRGDPSWGRNKSCFCAVMEL